MAEIEALYHSHGEALLRYLHRTFGTAAPANDLLQETFVHALANPAACTHAASPRAFLFGIARHVGLSAARRSKLTRREQLQDLAAPDTEKNDHALQDMRAAIHTLPPQIRETLELRLRDELSYEEIAAVLEVPVGTIRSRLHTALRLLKEQLHPPEAQ
jgi:RNA polymerase sigma-70 factor (ECF subfamily)